jgi:Domain of unknown function (DUF4371)
VYKFYLGKAPFQSSNYNFLQRDINDKMRRFNKDWFDQYNTWLEYSIAKDATFCLCCYIFRLENVGLGGRTSFMGKGYRCWKTKKGFDDHVGDSNSLHSEAYRRCMNLMNQGQSIHTVIESQSVKDGVNYRKQLAAIIDTIRLILRRVWTFREHDESESSSNSENFSELLRFLRDHNEKINDVILDNALKNRKLVALTIQTDIANACAKETIKGNC